MGPAENQREVIVFLSAPGNLDADGPVERIDTHAAIVFLAGDKAYKLKRAVDLGYLDFSTVARRKAVCEAELRLNRRTAPELYLGIVPVNRQANGELGFGPGEPVDWLVVMRRFPDDALLLSVAQRGQLDRPTIRALADEIARFHNAAEINTDGCGADAVRSVIEGNRRSMASLEPGALPEADCVRLYEASIAEAERYANLLNRRAAEGCVRRCHGDLHLANICLWEGRPLLFDCLEFSEELATTDVLYDLAFLVMDLWERGFHSEANLVFNRYLDMRDEIDGLAAFPLFLSMRAAVRAHVGATAASRQADGASGESKLAEARGYLDAALEFLRPIPARLVAVGGLSGTGKSTLAGNLAPRVDDAPGARWLRTDVLRKRMEGVAPEAPLPPEAYTKERNAEVYARLQEDARTCLLAGRSVIVDGVLARRAEREQIAAIATDTGARFAGLWLEAPEDLMVARVSGRTGDASDAGPDIVRHQLGYLVGDISPWQHIEAVGTPADVLEDALRHVPGCRPDGEPSPCP